MRRGDPLRNGTLTNAAQTHPTDRDRVFEELRLALDTQHNFEFEYRMFTARREVA
jgi:hypothetical protein